MSGNNKDSEKEKPGFDFAKVRERAGEIWDTALAHSASTLEVYGPKLKNFGFVTEPVRKLLETVDTEVYKVSDKLNRENPQFASMCRSHSSQLILTTSAVTGTLVAYPVRRLFRGPFIKTFIYTGLFNAALVYSACQVVTYKWEYPRAAAAAAKKA